VITEKDKADIIFGVNLNIEYVAMSYVGNADDVKELRNILDGVGSTSKIIAKIERVEAVENIDEIIKVADAIMIARGDLGEAIPIEKLPFVQHDLIKKCNKAGKMVIVATEMMSSMTGKDVPSRADVTDVANAVLSGADAVMLSNETAVGKYPVKVIEVMEKILVEAEGHVKSEYINL
jgi:pyruvate kinase